MSVTQLIQSAVIARGSEGGAGKSCLKKQHIRMLLVSDVTNVWVGACELSSTDLFSLLERLVAASLYICVTMTLPFVGNCLSACFVGRI